MSNQANKLIGQKSGLLTITAKSERRSKGGDIYWVASCECGGQSEVLAGNWRNGKHRSCGCIKKELYSKARAAKRPEHCTVDGCLNKVFLVGICKVHYDRRRKFGDVNYITPESVRRENNRNAQLARVVEVKPTTYRKLFGKHEHRVVAEIKYGRPIGSDEHVHHIDENKHNNHPDNLVVMSKEDHLKLHARNKK